jgi:class 3 adenylate cyclase/HAMP domain-containing protein
MKWFFLSPFALNVLSVSIILIFMINLLNRNKTKTLATKHLLFFLIGVTVVFLAFIIIFSSLNHNYSLTAWWILHLVVFSIVSVLQFVYHFHKNIHPRESKIVFYISLLAAILVYAYYFHKTLFLTPEFNFEGNLFLLYNTPEVGIVIGIQVIWISILLFRKAAAFSGVEKLDLKKMGIRRFSFKGLYLTLQHLPAVIYNIVTTRNKMARATRNIGYIFLSPLVLVGAIVLAYIELLSWEIVAHILGTGCTVAAFVFVLLYINHSSEPSTFHIKLVGISLGTVLIFLGLVANVALVIKDNAYDRLCLTEVRQCKNAVKANDFSNLSENILYIVAYPRKGKVSAKDYRNIYTSKDDLINLLSFEEKIGSISINDRNSLKSWSELERAYRRIDELDPRQYFIHFDFLLEDSIYEVGFSYLDYRQTMHDTCVTLVLIMLASTLFIVIVFPVFFKETLFKPLSELLSGVRKVNDGNLDVDVAVKVQDEIGFLALSFNKMVRSVSHSKTELKDALDYQVQLTDAYTCFVPKQFLRFLNKESIIDIKLGDYIQTEMTIMFSDIRSFTSLSEQMSPYENFEFINSYLSTVGPAVRKNNGFIDKYLGDGIMALFPENPEDAVKATIDMQLAMKRYNNLRMKRGEKPIKFGVGIHTGQMMLGTIGEEKRMEGTVISDAVNLAARMEDLTKLYGTLIIVSSDTLNHLENPSDYNYRFLDRVMVKGKKQWVDIFEVFDCDESITIERKITTKKDFEDGIAFYQKKNIPAARKCFNRVLNIHPDDQAATLYLHRCEHFDKYGIPADWDGITTLNRKKH